MVLPKLTIHYKKTSDGAGFIGMCPELEGVASQGKTLDELKDNLFDAARAMMAYNKWSAMKEMPSFYAGGKVYEVEMISGFSNPFEFFPPRSN